MNRFVLGVKFKTELLFNLMLRIKLQCTFDNKGVKLVESNCKQSNQNIKSNLH